MTISNTSIVSKEIIEAKLGSSTSPGYQEYIRRLLDKQDEPTDAGDGSETSEIRGY